MPRDQMTLYYHRQPVLTLNNPPLDEESQLEIACSLQEVLKRYCTVTDVKVTRVFKLPMI